jgi:hypothetical protein
MKSNVFSMVRYFERSFSFFSKNPISSGYFTVSALGKCPRLRRTIYSYYPPRL